MQSIQHWCAMTYRYSSVSTNWDFLDSRATQGTKVAVTTAGDVGLNCEPERAGNAACTSREATSLTLTGLVTDGGSLRFIIKVIRWRHGRFYSSDRPSRTPNEFLLCGRHLRAHVELLWNHIPGFPDSRSPVRSTCAATSLHQFNCQGSLTSFNCQP